MNVYNKLNEITLYIDDHLDEKIDIDILAHMLGINSYTFLRLFSLLTNYTLSEYIRMRRLSSAGLDLYNEKCFVVDVALKYGYESATSFSRAFLKFHGIKPSKIKSVEDIKIFPRIVFDTRATVIKRSNFKIEEIEEDLLLYGISIKTDNVHISEDAPRLFKNVENKYGPIKYAAVLYENEEREECSYYCVLYEERVPNSQEYVVPKGKYLSFRIDSQNPIDIQETSKRFYYEFLPSCKYNLRETPEIEYYHDKVCDFLVPIY